MLYNKEEIKKIIPYDDPFLFVEGVERIDDDEILGFYFARGDEDYFKGHFVDFKIMPGVLVVEAMAQLSTVLLRKKIKDDKKYHFLAFEVRGCQFFKPIFPGAKIDLRAKILKIIDFDNYRIAKVKAEASVERDLKAQARFSVVIIEKIIFNQKYQLC